ncbi:MAG: ATP-dependent DNA helicase RecG [Amoebophilaceae bacterium]|nr:ATP-dependent DNA helicase RecG [Amoebophilaceae bacterium]
MDHFFSKNIALIPGIEPDKIQLLGEELSIYTYEDLLRYYPFRYEERTHRVLITHLGTTTANVTLQGYITKLQKIGGAKKRLVALFQDETGKADLIWFQNFSWIIKKLQPNTLYKIWGKPTFTAPNQLQFIHPEITVLVDKNVDKNQDRPSWFPLYHTTDNLKKNKLDSKGIAALQKKIVTQLQLTTITETLPAYLLTTYRLISLKEAFKYIHFPMNQESLHQSRRRLKFEELFYIQLRLFKMKQIRLEKQASKVFKNLWLFNEFYKKHLPFSLTDDQKKVVRDIYRDLHTGHQMDRLLQGDVGSGKTIVAFLAMLIVVADGGQVAIMAPTEILAKQHYLRFCSFAEPLNLRIALLTGSTKKKERVHMLYQLKAGLLHIIVGTHALLNDEVAFKELAFFVIDEQHRFGVAQRAGLLTKNKCYFPHILIMTATPIPRTLAMTFYGDLAISTIYQLPEGRLPIQTQHYYEKARLRVFKFLSQQLALGRQVYMVYPFIEESALLDYHNLLAGYESVTRAFPAVSIGIIHGKMDYASKDLEMRRFEKNETSILVSTTVIEVGINVPNATVMVIESAERFGLSQMHQLRGRIGRGSAQSYCILMTGYQLNKVSKARIETMVKTTNGFEIAELDLKLRGPGDLMGLKQSGALDLKIADLTTDANILEEARASAKGIIEKDPNFQSPSNLVIHEEYHRLLHVKGSWSRIG